MHASLLLPRLLSTRCGDGWWAFLVLDGAGRAAAGLNRLDGADGLEVANLAEDNVTAIQPAGHNGGDEELGAVAVGSVSGAIWEVYAVVCVISTYVFGPALAIERRNGLLWVSLKFSSANFSP